jgi:hypothetical protein
MPKLDHAHPPGPRAERSLHLLLEAKLQSAVHLLPGLTSLLATAYLTLHLTVTAAVLLWRGRSESAGNLKRLVAAPPQPRNAGVSPLRRVDIHR